jgi:hypothetical protein
MSVGGPEHPFKKSRRLMGRLPPVKYSDFEHGLNDDSGKILS